jgi:hypothetical protein
MQLLAQFLLRLAFGLAIGMAITSPQKVFSGFYRNHLYVTLGLTTLATLVLAPSFLMAAMFSGIAAVCSFIGAACWLYESKIAGMAFVRGVALSSLIAGLIGLAIVQEHYMKKNPDGSVSDLVVLNLKLFSVIEPVAFITSGLTLGVTCAAMLLGHLYLNAPGMELAPLRKLLVVAAGAVVSQMLVVGPGLFAELSYHSHASAGWLLFVVLRWSFGLVGVLGLIWMAWETLKVPNTQSATGILYVAVIGVFIGELTGLLLSAESAYPL